MKKLIIILFLANLLLAYDCIIVDKKNNETYKINFYNSYIKINDKYTASCYGDWDKDQRCKNKIYSYSFLFEDGEIYTRIDNVYGYIFVGNCAR